MHALITAGGHLKADDPLFLETGIDQKALIPLAGKPMVQWVADSLLGSKHVESLTVVGLQPGSIHSENKPLHFLPDDQGSIVDNILYGAAAVEKKDPAFQKILFSSSDIPLITTPIVDEFVEICLPHQADIHYLVITKEVMEKRFPNSNRTFTRLKEGNYAGSDLMMLDREAVKGNMTLYRGITGNRKNFLAQARMLGFTFIFRFIFRLMDLPEALERAEKAFGIKGYVATYHRAEIAMDVDKLHHYELVKAELEERTA